MEDEGEIPRNVRSPSQTKYLEDRPLWIMLEKVIAVYNSGSRLMDHGANYL